MAARAGRDKTPPASDRPRTPPPRTAPDPPQRQPAQTQEGGWPPSKAFASCRKGVLRIAQPQPILLGSRFQASARVQPASPAPPAPHTHRTSRAEAFQWVVRSRLLPRKAAAECGKKI